MSSIDDRIVNMQFNNTQFEQGIAQTNASLLELKKNLNLNGATSGIDAVQQAANRFSMQNMEGALQSIDSKFSAFGAVAFSIINNLTNKVVDAGLAMGAALIDPIINGGERRALALQKAQFQFRGLGLDIEQTMTIARNAVLGTAFSLDQAATAAGQLGASGITAGHGLAEALRGIAGVAAQSGASFDQVAQIFEKVAGNGRLMGVELLQMSSYGINAAATLAKAMGTTEANIREMVTEGKISFQEFSDAMGSAFGDNAKKANELFTGALANMNAALARLGAEFEGPKLFNLRDIFNALSPLIDKVHVSLMPLIDAFNQIQNSGAAAVVHAIGVQLGPGLVIAIDNIVKGILALYGAVSRGFIQIFPENTGVNLFRISNFIQDLTAALIPSTRAIGQFTRIFAGLFAIFSILGQIISAVVNVFFDLVGVAAPAGDSFLSIAAKVGDFLVRIDMLLKKGQFVQRFFNTLGQIVAAPLAVLQTFFGIIADGIRTISIFGLSGDALESFSNDVETRFHGLLDVSNFIITAFKTIAAVAVAAFNFIKPVLDAISKFAGDVARQVTDALSKLSFEEANASLNSGLFASLILLISSFFGSFQKIISGASFGIIASFKAVLTNLNVNLKALAINTNVKTLKEIAIAVALLAASAYVLSLVDANKLAQALSAITGLITGLLLAFTAFAKIQSPSGIFTLLAMGAAIQSIAISVLILSAAVAILGAIPFHNLVKGVTALLIILAALTGAMLLLAKAGPQVIAGAIAIAIIAPAIVLLTGAIALLGAIPFPNLVQGLVGLGIALASLVGAMLLLGLVGPKVVFGAIAIALIAPAMVLLTGAIAAMAALPLANLVQGVIAFVVVIAALVGAMLLLGLVGPSVLIGAVAIAAVALSMVPLVGAIALLSVLPLDNLIAGMVAFTVALAILVGAVLLLGFTGPVALIGAAAIVAIALAIAVLAPALVLLSAISWDGIGRLLTVLSAGLGILVVMGILLIPASVGFLLLGVAILLIGQGVMLAATGVGILAAGIGLLVGVGAAGFGVLAAGVSVFIALLPQIGFGIGIALVNMAVAIGGAAPQLSLAFTQVLLAMLDAIAAVVPRIIEVATLLIVTLINALIILVPLLAEAGLTILEAFLNSIANHIERIVTLALLIIANFIQGLANGLPGLLQAGANLILSFINGVADTIRNNRQKFVDAALNIADALTGGLSTGILNGASKVIQAITKMVTNAINTAKSILGIKSPSKVFDKEIGEQMGAGAANGLIRSTADVVAAAKDLGVKSTDAVKEAIAGIGDDFNNNVDIQPTIRPVVDLSDIQNASRKIPGLMQAPTLSLDTTNGVAQSVSLQEQQRNAQIVLDASRASDTAKSDVTFIQNNNSPKALSTVELYRQTKNQLSTLKGDLGVVDQSGSS